MVFRVNLLKTQDREDNTETPIICCIICIYMALHIRLHCYYMARNDHESTTRGKQST